MLKSGFWKLAAPCLLIVAAAVAISFAEGDLADIVLGQGNFTSNTANAPDAHKLFSPEGVAIDTSGDIYVADYQNSRVLGWTSGTEFANGSPADLVIGQPDFYSSACNNGNGAIASAGSLCNPSGVAVDPNGNLYVADYANNRVLEYDTPFAAGCSSSSPCVGQSANLVFGQWDNLTSTTPNKGGLVSAYTLSYPYGVAVDSNGNLYVADADNNRVLEYNSPLTNGTTANMVFGQGYSFTSNTANKGGTVSASSLRYPSGVAVDASGDLYVADSENNRVLEYTPLANGATAIAVFGQGGSFTSSSCNALSGNSLCLPIAVAADTNGDLYVADEDNNRVLEYNAPLTNGATASAVFGQDGSFTSNAPNNGGVSASNLDAPWGLAVDTSGNLYVADNGNNRVLEYEAPLTNGASANYVLGQPDFPYNQPNFPDQYSLKAPYAVAIDASVSPNRLYVADEFNSRVLGWNDVATFTNGAPADLVIGQPDFYSTACNYDTTDGSSTANDLCNPYGVAVDTSGNLYVADENNNRVLEYNAPVTSGPSASMVFGQGSSGIDFTSNLCNFDTEVGITTPNDMCLPYGVAVDANNNLYVADTLNSRVLEYNTPLTVTATPGSGDTTADLVLGQTDFSPNTCNNGASPSASTLCNPTGVALDASGDLYVADEDNNRVLEYNAGFVTGASAHLVFGQGNNFTSTDCNTVSASSLCNPFGLTVDTAGRLWVADEYNNRVLEYNSPLTSGAASAVFGQGGSFSSNAPNNGGVSKSSLYIPFGVALDSSNNLYVADQGNNRVLKYESPLAPAATATATAKPTATPTTSMSVTPAPLAFGNVAVGQMLRKDLTVQNTGLTKPLIISNAISSDPVEYAVSDAVGTCGMIPVTVLPGGSCTMAVSFNPVAKATYNAKLTLTYNGGTGSQKVSLSGAGATDLTISKSSLVYGNVKLGATSVKSFNVTNNRTQPVTLSETLGGANPGDFSISGCTTPLAANSSCPISVTFTPSALGTESAKVLVSDSPTDDPFSPYTVTLSTGPTIPETVSPAALAYGNVAQTAAKTKNVTVTNLAGVPITLSESAPIGTNAGDFNVASVTSCAASSVCTIPVTFTPSTETAESASFTVSIVDDPRSPHTVSLTGTGLTPIKVAPTSHAFGTVAQGKSKTVTVTVTNNGGAPATLSKGITGADPAYFTVTGGTCTTLSPSATLNGDGATCTYAVTFTPTTNTPETATLEVTATGDAATHNVSLTGAGSGF